MHFFTPGNVSGQFTPPLPTCPGDTFTFKCTVGGDMSGVTSWRVGGSSECILVHRSRSSSTCGPVNAFMALSGIGFGTNSASFTSTLSGTADPARNGMLVECFGPANNVDPENTVGSSMLHILGQYVFPNMQSCIVYQRGSRFSM